MQNNGYTPGMIGLVTHPSTRSAAGSGWAALEAELDIWQAAGRSATFWWRDDDAIAVTPALDRLLALAEGIPVALAVIPGRVEASFAERLGRAPEAAVLQHGWRHIQSCARGRAQIRALCASAAEREASRAPAGSRALALAVRRPRTRRAGAALETGSGRISCLGCRRTASTEFRWQARDKRQLQPPGYRRSTRMWIS